MDVVFQFVRLKHLGEGFCNMEAEMQSKYVIRLEVTLSRFISEFCKKFPSYEVNVNTVNSRRLWRTFLSTLRLP